MNENVKALLKSQLWYLATQGEEPNAVPVLFKDVTDDGRLVVGNVFLNATLSNIRANGLIAVSACNGETLEGYQVKGRAEYVTEGPVAEKFKAMIPEATKGKLHAKGALVITPEKIIVTSVGPANGQEL